MKLLVTGGAGFIGSNFIRHILAEHPADSILNLDKLTYSGNLQTLRDLENDSRYSFVRGDICDRKKVQGIVSDGGFDAIVHFAAETHVDRSILDGSAFVKTNVLGTQCLLDAARRGWNQAFCPGQHGRGLRQRPLRREVQRGIPAGAQQSLRRQQGGSGPPGACPLSHFSIPGYYYAMHQQLWALPVPGKIHSPHADPRAERGEHSRLR